MGFPDSTAGDILDYATGRAVVHTAPFSVYLACLTADPGNDPAVADLSEDTTPGYARQQTLWEVPVGSPPATLNSAQVAFGPFTAAQANPITHVALVTSASGTTGTVRWVQPLDESLQAAIGDSHVFPVESLSLGAQS